VKDHQTVEPKCKILGYRKAILCDWYTKTEQNRTRTTDSIESNWTEQNRTWTKLQSPNPEPEPWPWPNRTGTELLLVGSIPISNFNPTGTVIFGSKGIVALYHKIVSTNAHKKQKPWGTSTSPQLYIWRPVLSSLDRLPWVRVSADLAKICAVWVLIVKQRTAAC